MRAICARSAEATGDRSSIRAIRATSDQERCLQTAYTLRPGRRMLKLPQPATGTAVLPVVPAAPWLTRGGGAKAIDR